MDKAEELRKREQCILKNITNSVESESFSCVNDNSN